MTTFIDYIQINEIRKIDPILGLMIDICEVYFKFSQLKDLYQSEILIINTLSQQCLRTRQECQTTDRLNFFIRQANKLDEYLHSYSINEVQQIFKSLENCIQKYRQVESRLNLLEQEFGDNSMCLSRDYESLESFLQNYQIKLRQQSTQTNVFRDSQTMREPSLQRDQDQSIYRDNTLGQITPINRDKSLIRKYSALRESQVPLTGQIRESASPKLITKTQNFVGKIFNLITGRKTMPQEQTKEERNFEKKKELVVQSFGGLQLVHLEDSDQKYQNCQITHYLKINYHSLAYLEQYNINDRVKFLQEIYNEKKIMNQIIKQTLPYFELNCKQQGNVYINVQSTTIIKVIKIIPKESVNYFLKKQKIKDEKIQVGRSKWKIIKSLVQTSIILKDPNYLSKRFEIDDNLIQNLNPIHAYPAISKHKSCRKYLQNQQQIQADNYYF